MIFFSVVIPTYNRAAVIANAINSVLNQSFQDFELIIVDDGSTDDTESIVSRFCNDKISYFKKINSGGSAARNFGIRIARGRYIAFLDSDDWFNENHLENAYNYLIQFSDLRCYYTAVEVSRKDVKRFLKPSHPILEGQHMSEYIMCHKGFVPTITLVVPNDLAKSVLYDENLSNGDDVDFAIRLHHAGAKFHMGKVCGAVWNDEYSPGRLSFKNNHVERVAWLRRNRELITEKAYLAEMGWPVAKYLFKDGQYTSALKHYLKAVTSGVYSPKVALMVMLQILLSEPQYRKLSKFMVMFGVRP